MKLTQEELLRVLEAGLRRPRSLGEDSEPEPDLAVVTREEEDAAEVHPRTALLVVEVAESSLRKDRLLKTRIYARAEVPEYWVVNVEGRAVEVYTAPDAAAGCYRMVRTLRPGEVLTHPGGTAGAPVQGGGAV